MVSLDIFADPVCPWCFIGKAALDSTAGNSHRFSSGRAPCSNVAIPAAHPGDFRDHVIATIGP